MILVISKLILELLIRPKKTSSITKAIADNVNKTTTWKNMPKNLFLANFLLNAYSQNVNLMCLLYSLLS